MGNLPLFLKDEEVRKLCETFGNLSKFNLVKDHSDGVHTSKGYCFFQYSEQRFAEQAIAGLNGLACGDKKLKVSRANLNINKQEKDSNLLGKSKLNASNSVK